jgi:hypothetical protein
MTFGCPPRPRRIACGLTSALSNYYWTLALWSTEPSACPPTTRLIFLGIELDSDADLAGICRMTIPLAKRERGAKLCDEFLARVPFSGGIQRASPYLTSQWDAIRGVPRALRVCRFRRPIVHDAPAPCFYTIFQNCPFAGTPWNTLERLGTSLKRKFSPQAQIWRKSKSGGTVFLNSNALERIGILPTFRVKCEKTDISAHIEFETRISFANPWGPFGTPGNYHPYVYPSS